ncbi:serine protease [Streptomyces sp. NPDC041003]|uniref:S1 family peptidase n=1 Tax=Streptomyces sp. NPDC041003 TaxID=3155730 RepID=UPI0033FA4D0C
MTGARYWVELFQSQQRLGGGFLLNRRYVLTALHCLQGLTALDDRLDVVLEDGSRVDGQVCRRDKEADLALIMVLGTCDVRVSIPRAGVAHAGDAWHAPYRPARTEVHLRGEVDKGAAGYLCEGGAVIQALQLTAQQLLGDYSGYSGGPVVKGVPDDSDPVVVGILLEQAPDRAAADRASNVLFAATIGEAMRRFDHFEVEHLMEAVHPEGPSPSRGGQLEGRTIDAAAASAELWFQQIDDWAGRRILDPSQIAELKFAVAKTVIERQLGGETA